jgi:hypothetical protein
VKEAVAPESASFTLHPQPVVIEEAPQASRPAPPVPPAPPAPQVKAPVTHINFDEPFEEEYARLIPSKPEPDHHHEGEQHADNLDIPAFLRRPGN